MGNLTNEEFVKMLLLFAERQNAKFLATTISICSPTDASQTNDKPKEKERYLQTVAEKDAELTELMQTVSNRKIVNIEMQPINFVYQEKELQF